MRGIRARKCRSALQSSPTWRMFNLEQAEAARGSLPVELVPVDLLRRHCGSRGPL